MRLVGPIELGTTEVSRTEVGLDIEGMLVMTLEEFKVEEVLNSASEVCEDEKFEVLIEDKTDVEEVKFVL